MLDFEKTADEIRELISNHYNLSNKEMRLLETLRAYLLHIRPEFSIGFDDFKKLFKCEYKLIEKRPYIGFGDEDEDLIYKIEVKPRIDLNIGVRKKCVEGFGMSWNLDGFTREGNNDNFLEIVLRWFLGALSSL